MAVSKNPSFHFHVSVAQANLHYYKVQLYIQKQEKKLRLFLPNWVPGSYKIRNFSRHVFGIKAFANRKKIFIEQVDLDSWEISSEKNSFIVEYFVYAFENSTRTNYLSPEFGFISPPALFFYSKEYFNSPVTVEFELCGYFSKVYTPLPKKENLYYAKNFDELYDSPFLLSNSDSYSYTHNSCVHEVVFEGGKMSEASKQNLVKKLKKITKTQVKTMQSCPNSYYLFIVNFTTKGYAGLEHQSCSVNLYEEEKLHKSSHKQEFLSLLSHEYFHLWNVKKIRPKALWDIDYQNPNLTKELWISEGITSFYDNYFLLLSKVIKISDYLGEVLKDINHLTRSEGEKWMSLESASFNTWIKYYMRDENSHNVSVSYYTKGGILALCMYLYILKQTKGKKSLTDVMRHLYKVYAITKKTGFTKQDFFDSCLEATGVDIYKEFKNYIEKPVTIPYQKYLSILGIKLARVVRETCLHFEAETENGITNVSKIYHERLRNVDISVGDEIIAINGEKVDKKKIDELSVNLKRNQQIKILLSRNGKEKEVNYQAKYHYIYDYYFNLKKELKENRLAKIFFKGVKT